MSLGPAPFKFLRLTPSRDSESSVAAGRRLSPGPGPGRLTQWQVVRPPPRRRVGRINPTRDCDSASDTAASESGPRPGPRRRRRTRLNPTPGLVTPRPARMIRASLMTMDRASDSDTVTQATRLRLPVAGSAAAAVALPGSGRADSDC